MKIIFEDKYFKVVNKPAGIISSDISPLICHRLDRGTSGLLIVAKSDEIKEAIQAQFKARKIKKEYKALVLGALLQEKVRIEGYVVRHQKKEGKRRFIQALGFSVKEKHKRLAISKYQVINKFKKELFKNPSQKDLNYFSLVKVRIYTGRTHQIRAQFASIHHPIVGDLLYGGKLMRQINQKLNLNRQFLHAYKLEFKHPITKKPIKLKSELPVDLKNVMMGLNNCQDEA